MSKPQLTSIKTETFSQLTARDVAQRIRDGVPQDCQMQDKKLAARRSVSKKPETNKLETVPEHFF